GPITLRRALAAERGVVHAVVVRPEDGLSRQLTWPEGEAPAPDQTVNPEEVIGWGVLGIRHRLGPAAGGLTHLNGGRERPVVGLRSPVDRDGVLGPTPSDGVVELY